MLVKMKKQDFDLLTDIDICQRCFELLIKAYKSIVAEHYSDDLTQLKENFYIHLNEGQQALFMFYTYYNHARKSIIEFYWWSAYFMAQPKCWLAIKDSLKYFEDESMIQLLEKIEIELKHRI